VFEPFEAAGVWSVGSRNELHFSNNTYRVEILFPLERYGVRDSVKG